VPFEDLRQGRLDIVPNYFTVDLPFYRQHLQGFLPDRIIDIHTHAEVGEVRKPDDPEPTYWPEWIGKGAGMTVPNLLQALLIIFPGKEVTPVIMGGGSRENVDGPAKYLIGELAQYPHIYGFMRNLPDWSEKEIIERYGRGRFSGLKPYRDMASPDIGYEEVTILDFMPRHQLKVAEERGWPIMLHIPKAERLADPSNIDQLKEIADTYPDVKIILAHIGRAYCPRFAEQGFAALGETAKFYYWDFSANLLQGAMELLIECAGPSQILYGSDLPILFARARRICEGDNYVNLMREADWADSHTRLAPPEERGQVTFMLYEEIAAFKRAAEARGLTQQDIEDVFYNNACRLLKGGS
jgi:predicted TIM-barrel fold metal-dependent hydrolase